MNIGALIYLGNRISYLLHSNLCHCKVVYSGYHRNVLWFICFVIVLKIPYMYWISRKLVNDHPDNSYIHVCYILCKRKILLLRIQDVVNLCPKDKIPIYILFVLFTTVSVFECLLIFVLINAFMHVVMLLKAWTISCATSVPHWYQYFMCYLKSHETAFYNCP